MEWMASHRGPSHGILPVIHYELNGKEEDEEKREGPFWRECVAGFRVVDKNRTEVRWNGEWLRPLTLVDVLRLASLLKVFERVIHKKLKINLKIKGGERRKLAKMQSVANGRTHEQTSAFQF